MESTSKRNKMQINSGQLNRRAGVRLCVFLIVCLAALGGAASAGAGTVSVELDSPARGTLVYEAGAGEANNVTVEMTSDLSTWLVTDTGAPLTVGEGCTAVDAQHASCPAPTGVSAYGAAHLVDISLGDMDDWASGASACFPREDDSLFECSVTIDGGDGDDTLIGNDSETPVGHDYSGPTSRLAGGAGDDILRAAGSVAMAGGPGADFLEAGVAGSPPVDWSNSLDGGLGADEIVGRGPHDHVTYADRVNRVFVSLDGRRNDGEAGEGDLVTGVEGIRTGSGADVIVGDERANGISAGAGNDLVYARGGNDGVGGGDGADRLYGGTGSDSLSGWNGNDVLAGLDGSDRLEGEAGDDRLYGGEGSDDGAVAGGQGLLDGGPGNDRIGGGPGRDLLEGWEGNDILYARDGSRDRVRGRQGYDRAQIDRGLDARSSIERLF
jgi:Ca2+-binding RTX toxin-like protein